MPLPEPILDDLRFQKDLVDEARRRIINYCPEWTDYNLSDPGITLIELFAWMTELITYRLNRAPEQNYIRFLNMLGIQLQPPSSARTVLTFRLSTPIPINPSDETVVSVPKGTEVSTPQQEGEPEIIFTTDERLVIVPPVITQLRRDVELNKNYLPRLKVEIFQVFGRDPKEGDTFYIGFEEAAAINGQILQMYFECEPCQAPGIRRDDPPLVWECSTGNGQWREIVPSTRPGEENTTGGLNNPTGRMVFYLPLEMSVDEVHSKHAYWIRCRFEIRRAEQGKYTESPKILNIVPTTMGGSVWATHAVIQEDEILGRSSGEAGQMFKLEHAPILDPEKGETIEVEEMRDGELVFYPWQRVRDFSRSERYDRHFTLDPATGQVEFGPAIRQRDGTVRLYGRVPEPDRRVRFSRYRYGGGAIGNVPAGKVQTMRTSLAYIDRVTNMVRAEGGRDQETLDEAKMRARREIRAQERAVTAEDFENLARRSTRAVARVKCHAPEQVGGQKAPGVVELLVVPAVYESMAVGDYSKLKLDAPLRQEIVDFLDNHRLLTTILRVRAPEYMAVRLSAEIAVSEYSHPETVRMRVIERLQQFITPLPMGNNEFFTDMMGADWEGWPFGRDLYVSEIFSLIQQVPGVKHVLDVQIGYCSFDPDQPVATQNDETLLGVLEAAPLIPLTGRMLEVSDDTVLCSLRHDIRVVTL